MPNTGSACFSLNMSTRYGGLKPWPSFKHYRLEIFRIINWFDEVNIQTSALARIKLPLKTLSRQTDFQTPVVQFSISISLLTSMTGDVAGEG